MNRTENSFYNRSDVESPSKQHIKKLRWKWGQSLCTQDQNQKKAQVSFGKMQELANEVSERAAESEEQWKEFGDKSERISEMVVSLGNDVEDASGYLGSLVEQKSQELNDKHQRVLEAEEAATQAKREQLAQTQESFEIEASRDYLELDKGFQSNLHRLKSGFENMRSLKQQAENRKSEALTEFASNLFARLAQAEIEMEKMVEKRKQKNGEVKKALLLFQNNFGKRLKLSVQKRDAQEKLMINMLDNIISRFN